MTRKTHRLIALLLCCALLAGTGSAAAEKTLTVTFTGDCTLGSEEATRKDPYSFDSMAEKEGYDYFFKNFREMFPENIARLLSCETLATDYYYLGMANKNGVAGKELTTPLVKL